MANANITYQVYADIAGARRWHDITREEYDKTSEKQRRILIRSPRESAVKAHLLKRCAELGIEARKVHYEGRKGAWDWWLFFKPGWRPHRNGGLAIVELKAFGEPLEHHQIEEGKVYEAAGIVHRRLDSVEAVEDFLK